MALRFSRPKEVVKHKINIISGRQLNVAVVWYQALLCLAVLGYQPSALP